MTSDPKRGADAIGYLEHDLHRTMLQNAAEALELRMVFTTATGLPSYMFWVDREAEGTYADFVTLSRDAAYGFLYGAARAIQGNWTP